MFRSTTLDVTQPLLETLENKQLLLQPRAPHLPVAVMAGHYSYRPEPTYTPISGVELSRLVEDFRAINKDPDERVADDFDRLVELMAHGLTKMLVTARTVVVPLVKEIHSAHQQLVANLGKPKIEVVPYNYHPIHDEVGLTAHIADHYQHVRLEDHYRSFIIERPALERLVEIITSNRHTDPQLAKEWALTVGGDVLSEVWHTLFGDRRELTHDQLTFTTEGQPHRVYSLDKLLVAYFFTSHLRDEPQEVVGESVPLEVWEATLERLHRYFGAQLLQFYQKRAKDRQKQRLVFCYAADQAIRKGGFTVYVNGDVYPDWLANGGDVRLLLGAALLAPNRFHAGDFPEADAEALITGWERQHYLIKQTAQDRSLRQQRDMLEHLLLQPSAEVKALLPDDLPYPATQTRVRQELMQLTGERITDQDIARVVCRVFFPDTPYFEFLDTMERMARQFPDLPPREAATMATVELTAQWLVSQLQAVTYQPLINPTPAGRAPEVVEEETVTDADDVPAGA